MIVNLNDREAFLIRTALLVYAKALEAAMKAEEKVGIPSTEAVARMREICGGNDTAGLLAKLDDQVSIFDEEAA